MSRTPRHVAQRVLVRFPLVADDWVAKCHSCARRRDARSRHHGAIRRVIPESTRHRLERNTPMRGTVLHAPRDVRVEDRPDPKIEHATDAVIRLAATCVCGSDLWPY